MTQHKTPQQDRNEGEGSRSAANRYNEKTRDFAKSGRVEKKAEEARRALDSGQQSDLSRAEQAGRDRAKDEDPYVSRPRKEKSDPEH